MLITSEKVPVDLFKIFSTVPFKSGPSPEKKLNRQYRVLYKGPLQRDLAEHQFGPRGSLFCTGRFWKEVIFIQDISFSLTSITRCSMLMDSDVKLPAAGAQGALR